MINCVIALFVVVGVVVGTALLVGVRVEVPPRSGSITVQVGVKREKTD